MATEATVAPDEFAGLLGKVAGGDRAAFSDLYDRVVDVVYGLARRIVRDHAIAAEVAQDVMVTVWRKAGDFDPTRGRSMAWIATITRRRAIDVVRSNQAARRREDRQPPDPLVSDPVGERVGEIDEYARVRSALSSLTDREWAVIRLAYFEGLSYREVAEKLEIPLGTVKTRARSGLLRLSGTMENDDG